MQQTIMKHTLITCCFLCCTMLFSQKTVTGTVTDQDGVPLPGVTVLVEGTNNGTSTDFDGQYTIQVSDGQTLSISFVGYQTQQISVANNANFNVRLQPDQLLTEVVVTALGLSREKKSLGYAVTQVDGDQINTIKDHNLANALAGKVPGLNITQSSSIGAGSRIVLRGNNSLSTTGSSQALIVVDGVPINADETDSGGSVYNSVTTGGGITDINPNDVESVSVLKGPNAAALYGSRAGGGVVLITTKKGVSDNRLGVTINTNLTIDSPMVLPDFQNTYGQGTLGAPYTKLVGNYGGLSWGAKMDGSQQLYFTGQNKAYDAQPNNVRNFFTTGVKAITSVSLNKGSENGSLRFSYTNNNTESILPNSDLNSHNFNLRGTSQLSDKLSIDAKATYYIQEVTNRQGAGSEGVIYYVYGMPRSVDVRDLEKFQADNPGSADEYRVINYAGPGSSTANPYWMLRHDVNDERRNRFLAFTKIDYQFNDWLSAFVRVGADATNIKRVSINKPGHHFYSSGRMTKSENNYGELNSELLITAKTDITDKLNLVANVGGNLSRRTTEGISNFGENFRIPTKFFFANLANPSPPNELPLAIKKVNSLYGSANFAYDNFLYVDLTSRNDWSSTLKSGNNSYFYSSASVSALLHQFIDPEHNTFDLVKLRGSWAEVGNDTAPYQIYDYFNVAGQGYLGRTTLSAPDVKFNLNLMPEAVTSTEVGLEVSMLKNRLGLDISVYNNKTNDLIFDLPVSPATGYKFYRINVGEITNKGIEVALRGAPIQNENFSWNSSLFVSQNKTKLVKLDGIEYLNYNSTNSGNFSSRAQVGGSIGDFYGSVWDTDDKGNKKVNANGIPVASTPDKYLGSAQPDWLGGWQNSFQLNDFTLSFLIDARIGGQIYSATSAYLDSQGVSARSLQYRESGVVVDGMNTSTNAANTNSITGQQYWSAMAGIAENYVYDQTNVRLRELAIGYFIPNANKIGLQSASIQLIGRNLFFLMKEAEDIDPENNLGTSLPGQGINSGNLPTVRSLGLNLTLNF